MMKLFDPLVRPSIRHHVDKFFNDPARSLIYKIKVPTEVFAGLLDYDLIKTFSNHLDVAQNADLKDISSNINKYNTEGWPCQLNSIRILQKVLWILKDFDNNIPVLTPFQFLKTQYGYMVHPGTSKLLVTAYLNPIQYHQGFYVHSEQIDPDSMLLDYKVGEIDDTEEFISQFNFQKFFFKFRTINVTPRIKLSSHSYLPKYYAYYQTFKNLNYKTITYYDNHNPNDDTNWAYNRYDTNLADDIKFIDNNNCLFHNIKFKKINNTWIKT